MCNIFISIFYFISNVIQRDNILITQLIVSLHGFRSTQTVMSLVELYLSGIATSDLICEVCCMVVTVKLTLHDSITL